MDSVSYTRNTETKIRAALVEAVKASILPDLYGEAFVEALESCKSSQYGSGGMMERLASVVALCILLKINRVREWKVEKILQKALMHDVLCHGYPRDMFLCCGGESVESSV
jgi:hypothetical protein